MLPLFRVALAALLTAAPLLPAAADNAPQAPPAPASPACRNPSALGTSRVMAVGSGIRIGLKTYPQTLDLADHEVVLTFDDGPLPSTTPEVLEALERECVRATFFVIGRHAAAYPDLVRREIADGDSVGHHTLSHPAATLRGIDAARGAAEIEQGFAADDKAAFGAYAGEPRTPFFRFPGFADTAPLLEHLAKRHVAVFGADLWASDWEPMTPEEELTRLTERLDRAGRGIILLHDIRRQTAAMLPAFLRMLKQKGYRVVHLVPGPESPMLRQAPAGWTSETERTIDRLMQSSGRRFDPERRAARDLGLRRGL